MLIDCDSCAVRNLACGDCVVTVLLGMPATGTGGDTPHSQSHQRDRFIGHRVLDAPDPGVEQEPVPVTRVELDNPERAAIAVLAAHGLVPPLRLVPRDDAPDDQLEGGELKDIERKEDELKVDQSDDRPDGGAQAAAG